MGLNDQDREMLKSIMDQLAMATESPSQYQVMAGLLWARHLLETLLRRMQDD